jgi:hypothetical protein
MKARDFIYLRPSGMRPAALSDGAYSAAVETWLCPGCAAPKPSIGVVDVQIEARPLDAPLTFISGCGLLLAHHHLLEAFSAENVASDLMLGTVKDLSGDIMSDWVTVRGQRRLIVRGSDDVSYRRCNVCGRHVYFAMGEKYLFPEPPTNVSIFESSLGLVVTRDAIDDDVVFEGWPNLEVKRLKVLAVPKDSLGDLI